MPQMKPLNWLTLFLCFTIFFMFNIIKYYMILYRIKMSSMHKTTMKFNWKW